MKNQPTAFSSDSNNLNKKKPNHLKDEKSPYLLQHVFNAVDWYPWGERAFEIARSENKPIFLSIGYSTCHWCHVMERESFEDLEVGRLMNDAFVSIKVDREERPDIDTIYMQVAMKLNGQGGWPLNLLIMPDGKPFFAATYIPKEDRFGRAGLLTLIAKIKEVWSTDYDRVLETANQLSDALENLKIERSDATLDEDIIEIAYQQLSNRFDNVHGGFGSAPKFPSPHNILFLLRYWERSHDSLALKMVESTLQAMRYGGIFDQIGFGFHRYSTDNKWLLPHFEKMLYDQALLAMAYTETYQITKNPDYEQTAREIFTYVLRDMVDPEGGFYSAEDADSDGEEGKYYFWSETELRGILSTEEFNSVIQNFNFSPDGNFIDEATKIRTGTNIPHLTRPLGIIEPTWQNIRQKMYQSRLARIHPFKDDKILTDWNGLMIASLAKSAQVFNEPLYITAAERAAKFIMNTLKDGNDRLLHRYRSGDAAIHATLNDYVFIIWGLLELYEATFNIRHLENAINLQDQQIAHFWDSEDGGYYLTADDGELLISRPKEIYDGAIPSGNSIAMQNLLRLSRITADPQYENYAASMSHFFAQTILQSPIGYTQFLSAVMFSIGPSLEIVIVGDPDTPDTEAMVRAIRGVYFPNKVVIFRHPKDDAPILKIANFTRYHHAIDGKATAFVCNNYICHQPTTDINIMLSLLRETIQDNK
ncbi:MAG: thioredoxin domain-containing protein [Anaerolineae bacterium]|nr:thioredoxin domain-containing protein [Anaerolineae bacterium]